MLINLKDGGVKNIFYDSDSDSGCETCDYGSRYVNEFILVLTKGKIEFKVSQMYDFALSEDYMMKLFLQNIDEIREMTEKELFYWLESNLEKDFKHKVKHFGFTATIEE